MFVICWNYNTSCEVFNSFSRKFTKVNSEIKVRNFEEQYFNAFSIGNNIVIFQGFRKPNIETVIYLYDEEKGNG